jgi:hypothetical protein
LALAVLVASAGAVPVVVVIHLDPFILSLEEVAVLVVVRRRSMIRSRPWQPRGTTEWQEKESRSLHDLHLPHSRRSP